MVFSARMADAEPPQFLAASGSEIGGIGRKSGRPYSSSGFPLDASRPRAPHSMARTTAAARRRDAPQRTRSPEERSRGAAASQRGPAEAQHPTASPPDGPGVSRAHRRSSLVGAAAALALPLPPCPPWWTSAFPAPAVRLAFVATA